MFLLPQTILRLLDFVLVVSSKLALRNDAVNIIMRAVHESVEYKNNFSLNLKDYPKLIFTPIKNSPYYS